MKAKSDKYIGSGLYTISEAALYARVSPRVLHRWLFGTKDRRPVLTPQYGSDERLVSFLDLVQALAIREIRLMHDIPLPKFRQAIRWAKSRLGVDYPFARRHFTYLFGKELVIEFKKGQYVEVSGRNPGQGLLREVVEMYLQNLTFGKDGLASSYHIFAAGGVPIVMDPARRFGEPLLPSGYSARCIWESIKAEGSIAAAAAAYGIRPEEVTAAYLFINQLGPLAA